MRGSTHVIAYAKALETLSGGVEVAKLFPIPELSTNQFPEARKYVEQGLYNTMYSFSQEDISAVGEIWKGPHPDGAPDLVVTNDPIPTTAPIPKFEAEPQLAAPSASTPNRSRRPPTGSSARARLRRRPNNRQPDLTPVILPAGRESRVEDFVFRGGGLSPNSPLPCPIGHRPQVLA